MVNHEFLSNISSETPAYWLGFLMADGSISGGQLALVLAQVDIDHLFCLRKVMKSTHAIIHVTKNIGYGVFKANRFSVRSKQLCLDFRRWRDHILLHGPNAVMPQDCIRHFWRGIIDGDGYVGLNSPSRKNGKPKWRVGLYTDRATCEHFANWARTVSWTRATVRPHKSIFSVEICGRELPVAIMRELYKESTIALPRKKAVFERTNAADILLQYAQGDLRPLE